MEVYGFVYIGLKLPIEKLDCKRRQYITIRNCSFDSLKH